jgi:hypothetical protein
MQDLTDLGLNRSGRLGQLTVDEFADHNGAFNRIVVAVLLKDRFDVTSQYLS